MSVTVSGLPAKSKLKMRPHVRLMGPTGNHVTRTWRVGRDLTVKDLEPGFYVVTARYAVGKSGRAWLPKKQSQWVKVRRTTTTRVSVNFETAPPGIVIPPPAGEGFPIDIASVCRDVYQDRKAAAWYRSNGDPYSWYCQLSNGRETGLDLDKFCSEEGIRRGERSKGYHSHPQGMQWYCITGW
jgi:hypothetical protein